MPRPVVLVDCDGVLSNFTQSVLDHVHNISGERYSPESVTTWEVTDSLPISPEVKAQAYDRMRARGGCLSISVFPEAQKGIARLADIADVVVVTSPWKGSETWAHERELWLEQHFGSAIDHVIHARNKTYVRGDMFIDDKPEHVEAWMKYWRPRDPRCIGVYWDRHKNQAELWSQLHHQLIFWCHE